MTVKPTYEELEKRVQELEKIESEYKYSKEALRENDSLFKMLYEKAPLGYQSLDENGHFIVVNQTWLDTLGYTREEVIGKSFADYLHPDWRDHFKENFPRFKSIGEVLGVEFEMVKKNGNLILVSFTGKISRDKKGEFQQTHCIFHDITDRKKHEELLERYKNIVSSTTDAIAYLDENYRYIIANDAYEDFSGVKQDDFIGMTVAEYMGNDIFEEKIKSNIDRCLNGEVVNYQEWFEYPAKGKRFVDVTYFPYRDGGNHISGVIASSRDITERRQVEKKLKMAHEKLLTILDSIDSTVYVADMDTFEILFMNKKMITDFGGDKTGDFCYHAFRKNSGPCECCTNDQLVDKHKNPAGVRIWDDKNPVTGRDYINYDRAIEWTDGRLVRMQIATDITDLKKLESQLNQAQKMESVGRLAGGVAHDFNNMLGVILGHTELAMLHADENHDLHADLNEIQNAAKRSADLVKKLLAFARKEIISPKQLDLNDTVESMLNMLRRLIGEDIDLVWKPAAHLWPVKMDPSQIDQIFANLCVNARDAISGVGKLTIETGIKTFDEEYCKEHAEFIPGDFVLLAVSDNGCGMDKETLDNLFEPFFTTKEVGKGTGLGLATIYGIVKQNKGFINVYSEPGQGSSFKIYLPRLIAQEDTDKAVPVIKATAGGTETILLVEDEPSILRMTRMMLERKGYTVLSAATPTEAVEKATNHSGFIDLLMTDVVMPEMNGRDLSGKITDLYPDTRLLFMSGYTANVIAHQGVLDDGVAFIQKPFSMADMTAKVRELLDMASDKHQ
jgi:PAS domain S-box-containing protein